MKKINLLIVTSHLWIGGAETVIAHLCRRLDRGKFNVDICCLVEIGEVGEALQKEGYNVISLLSPDKSKVNYLSFIQLNKLIKSSSYHLLHSHTTQSLIDSNICRIINNRIRTLHTFHFGNYPYYNKKYLFFEKIFSRIADVLVTVGKDQNERIVDTFNCKKAPLIIRNGVPQLSSSRPAERIRPYLEENKTIIGAVNTLIEQKGTTYLLDVAKNLKECGHDFVFLIAGEGPLRQSLELKARKLGVENDVVFLGWVKDASSKIIPYIDIFIQPSLWEAMSVVVLEAMMCAKPVVVTQVGENPHVIENGQDGLLCEPKDIQMMTQHLEFLIVNQDRRKEIGSRAKKKVLNNLDIDTMVKKYEELYENIYKSMQPM